MRVLGEEPQHLPRREVLRQRLARGKACHVPLDIEPSRKRRCFVGHDLPDGRHRDCAVHMHVEFSPIMHVGLRSAVVEVVGYAQKAWQIKLPRIQSPS